MVRFDTRFEEFRRAHLHNLILELGQEEVDDLVLLDGERVEVDLLHALDLASLDETAQLGDWLPLLLVALAAAPTSTSTATAATTLTATVTPRCETAAAGARSPISHFVELSVVVDWGFVVVVDSVEQLGEVDLFRRVRGLFGWEILDFWCAKKPTLKSGGALDRSLNWQVWGTGQKLPKIPTVKENASYGTEQESPLT
jgi:hypothetical protein